MQKTVFILVGWAVFYYLKNKSGKKFWLKIMRNISIKLAAGE